MATAAREVPARHRTRAACATLKPIFASDVCWDLPPWPVFLFSLALSHPHSRRREREQKKARGVPKNLYSSYDVKGGSLSNERNSVATDVYTWDRVVCACVWTRGVCAVVSSRGFLVQPLYAAGTCLLDDVTVRFQCQDHCERSFCKCHYKSDEDWAECVLGFGVERVKNHGSC